MIYLTVDCGVKRFLYLNTFGQLVIILAKEVLKILSEQA